MNDPWSDRLSEFVDDELDPPSRAALLAHLADCAECRGAVSELREIAAWAGTWRPAPSAREPWGAIATDLRGIPQQRAVPWRRALAIAAGIAIIVLGVWPRGPAESDPLVPPASNLVRPANAASELSARLSRLPAATQMGVAAAIASIDSALADLDRRLEVSPGSTLLQELRDRSREQRDALVRNTILYTLEVS